MPKKLNKAGKMQDYIPAGNGDPSGEYGTAKGTNKNFTTSDKKKTEANVITENKSVVVGDKGNLPSKEELQKVKDKYGVSSDEDALRIIDKWDEWSKSKEGHDKLVKKLEDRIDNYEGVLENIKNGDETGKEKVEDYTRELRNAREEYKKLTGGKEYKSKIDKEKEMDNFRKTKANIIDNDLTKTFGENEKYDKSYSNNPELEEKLKSNIAEKLNEEFKGKSDEYIRQNGFTIAKGIASSEIRKDEFKDLKFNSFGSNSSNFDNMVRASLEQRKIGIKKNDNLTPTNALKIENMNEAQLDNEIAKTQREIDRLDSVMKSNTKESELTKQFPLGVGGSGWSADRKKQFVKNIESETKQAKNFTDAYKDKESLKNRLDALNKAKEQVKGTGKTQEQLKQNVINNTQNTINWKKGKIANPYGKGEINVIKANGYEIRSVDNGFYSIYKDGKSVGNTNKLKDAKAYVERIVQKQSKANVIS